MTFVETNKRKTLKQRNVRCFESRLDMPWIVFDLYVLMREQYREAATVTSGMWRTVWHHPPP